jgi:UDP-glucose 4-epimerase
MGKILVTGGIGYIGSHTVVALQEKGHDVLIVDNLSNSNLKVVSQIAKITGKTPAFTQLDVCNSQALMDYFRLHPDITGVIHFAAYKAVGESSEFPLKYYHNNLVSLINLLLAMQSINCNNLVFSSSCTVYGQPEKLPVTENAPIQQAYSPYGNTKQISEEIISEHVATSSLKAISLRYFNPIGAHQSALIGELPLGMPNNLVPFITQTAIGKRKSLSVFGSDYNTSDGTCIRDYIHVIDLSAAHILALQPGQSGFYNLGNGEGYSVRQVIEMCEKISGKRIPTVEKERRPGDPPRLVAAADKAMRELGWKPSFPKLEQIVATAWSWHQKNPRGYGGEKAQS